jgi:ubiquinone/menaquinone biosynthesis C-methylase UbiE
MNHENHSEPIWDEKNAKWYAEKYGNHISNAMTIQNADLKKDDFFLDIGCGTGTACREAAKIITNGTIIGMDPTPTMIRISKEQTSHTFKNVEFILGASENIPIDNNSITICTAINSLHHWSDYKKGFEEILRVIKSQGRLIISDEIVSGNSCGHGEGPISNPKKVIEELKNASFTNVIMKTCEVNGDGIYLFSAEKC